MSTKPYPWNPCSSNFTQHANKVIIRVSQALSAFPKSYPCYPWNPCSSNLTHHAYKVIIRVSQALSASPKSYPCYPWNPCSLNLTQHANKVLIRVPSKKIRVIRVICVQKPPPHTPIKIQIRVQKTPNKFIIRGFFLPHTSYYKKMP